MIGFSPQVIDELTSRAATLRRERESLADRTAAIDRELAAIETILQGRSETPVPQTSNGLPLKDKIKAALLRFDESTATPRAVTEFLVRQGLLTQRGKKTDLKILVSTELHRLARDGQGVERVARGVYRLAKENETE